MAEPQTIDTVDEEKVEEIMEAIEGRGSLDHEEIIEIVDFESEEEAREIISNMMDLGYITATLDWEYMAVES